MSQREESRSLRSCAWVSSVRAGGRRASDIAFGGLALRCLGRVLPMWGSSGIWNPKLNEWFRPGIHSTRKLPPVPNKPPRLK